jgi:WD40 repeat protein
LLPRCRRSVAVHHGLLWAVTLLWSFGGRSVAVQAEEHEPKQSDRIRVICPAIDEDGSDGRVNAPVWSHDQPVEMVVLGVVKELKKGRDSVCEVAIEKVLYGHPTTKAVQFNTGHLAQDGERRIWGLMPDDENRCAIYKLSYERSPHEERAERALALARLDYYVLSADSIVLARETATDEYYHYTVHVDRVLSGSKFKAGSSCILKLPGVIRTEGKAPAVCRKPTIFFVQVSSYDPLNDRDKIVYRLPAPFEADVLAALERRKSYPVVAEIRNGHPAPFQEVLFRGSPEEAIQLLGSERLPAQTLGSRRLLFDKAAAAPKLAAVIEREMFQQGTPVRGKFRLLQNAIKLLGRLDRLQSGRLLPTLMEKQLGFLVANPPPPPETKRTEWEEARGNEYWADDVNHSLAWIAAAMDEEVLARDFGSRLLQLRKTAKGRWQAEVQLALDYGNVEDNLELAALRRKPAVRPVSSERRICERGGIRAIAFSNNGKFLATAGTWENLSVWSTADWRLAQAIELPATISCLAFSPDDRFLYVGGSAQEGVEEPEVVHCRFDWRSGKLDRVYEGHKNDVTQIKLSSDGRTIVSFSRSDNTVKVCDTQTGKPLRSIPWRATRIAYAPATNVLVGLSYHHGTVIEKLNEGPGKETRIAAQFEDAAFTSDGQSLAVLGPPLQVRRADAGLRILHEKGYPDAGRLALSSDGRFVAVASPGCRLGIFTFPDLQPVRDPGPPSVRTNEEQSVPSIAFSPDGKWLVAGEEFRSRPRFLRAETGQELIPFEGHADDVIDLRFAPHGRTLRSVGQDGTVCVWDAASMKMLRRFSVPSGTAIVSIRPSDGRYALCVENRAEKVPGQIVDLEMGIVLCKVSLPVNPEFDFPWAASWDGGAQRLFWLNDSEAFAISSGRWRRFNYHTGKILSDGNLDIDKNNSLYNCAGEPVENGKRLFSAHDGGKRTPPWKAEETVLPGFELKELGTIDTKGFPEGPFGLVPGDKYFHIGAQIFDLRSLKRVAAKEFFKRDVDQMTFSADGSRYCAVVSEKFDWNEWPHRVPRTFKMKRLLRVQESLSGRTLLAITLEDHVRFSRLSSDGRRLAAAISDGSIQVWKVAD